MIDRDLLENALEALGCPDPLAVANLVVEILPELLPKDAPTTGQRLTKERGSRYSHPSINWKRIGRKWAATLDLDEPVPPALVGIMLMDIKTARLIATPDDPDSLDDLEGYAEAQRMLFRPPTQTPPTPQHLVSRPM